jgi:hypothetical protein
MSNGNILPEFLKGIDCNRRNDAIEQGYLNRDNELTDFYISDGMAFKIYSGGEYYYLIDWGLPKIEKLSKKKYNLLNKYR